MRLRTSQVLVAISFLWLLVVLVLYYAGHKPGEPEQLLAIVLAAWRLLVALGLTALAGGLGARLLTRGPRATLDELALQAGAGFGLLGLGVLAAGTSLGLPVWLPWLAFVLLAFFLRRSIAAWLRGWGGLAQLWQESGAFERVLAGLSGAIFLLALCLALAPPIGYDSLMYHLALPNTYLNQARVSYLPWHAMSGMPQTAELLYAWAMALGGREAAAVLGWMFGLLSMLGLLGCLRRAWDARAAWVGTGAILAGFSAAMLLSNGYVDWLVFLIALGVMILLADWRQTGARRSLAWAGILTGLAVGSKYTSGVLGLAGLAVLAVQLRRRPLALLKAALLYGLAAGLAAAPWFLKNLLTTGNPVYPFFLGGGAMTAVRMQVYQSVPPFGNWLDILFLPVRATYLGFDAGEGYMFAPGMLLLALGGLAWLDGLTARGAPETQEDSGSGDGPCALLGTAVLLACAGLVVWVLGNQLSGNLIQTRYYFAIFPAFGVLAAAGDRGLRRLRLGSVRMGRMSAVFVLLALVFNVVEFGLVAFKNGAPQAALGLKTQEAYLADALGWFEPAMRAVRELPEGKQAQLIYEARSLYCAPRCLPDELLDRWKRAQLEWGDDPAQVLRAWRAQGITHLLVSRQGMRFLREVSDPHHPLSDLDALDKFLSTLPGPVNFGDVYALYSLE